MLQSIWKKTCLNKPSELWTNFSIGGKDFRKSGASGKPVEVKNML